MSTLTKPQARVAIGWAMVNGQRLPVTIDIEWDRYMQTLAERVGGINGLSTTDVDAGGYAAMQPAAASDQIWPDIGQTMPAAGDSAGDPMQFGAEFGVAPPDVLQADLQQSPDIYPMQA